MGSYYWYLENRCGAIPNSYAVGFHMDLHVGMIYNNLEIYTWISLMRFWIILERPSQRLLITFCNPGLFPPCSLQLFYYIKLQPTDKVAPIRQCTSVFYLGRVYKFRSFSWLFNIVLSSLERKWMSAKFWKKNSNVIGRMAMSF